MENLALARQELQRLRNLRAELSTQLGKQKITEADIQAVISGSGVKRRPQEEIQAEYNAVVIAERRQANLVEELQREHAAVIAQEQIPELNSLRAKGRKLAQELYALAQAEHAICSRHACFAGQAAMGQLQNPLARYLERTKG